MSEAEDRRASMCAGKEGFRDRRIAEGVARKQNRRKDARVRVYRCPICKLYHAGTWNGGTDGGTVPRTEHRPERERPFVYDNDFDRRKR